MSEQMTEWYPADIKPVNIGPYITRLEKDGVVTYFQYWNGEKWGASQLTAKDAARVKNHETRHQEVKWRGLRKPADAAQ